MPRQILVMLALVSAIAIAPVSATTLSGTVTYVDQTDRRCLSRRCRTARPPRLPPGGNVWTYGTVDSVSGTYEIPGLTEGQWFVRIIFGTEDFGTRVQPKGGEVTGFDYIDIGTEPEAELDLGALYAYRITQPYAGVWPGLIGSCPYGPAQPAEFTLRVGARPARPCAMTSGSTAGAVTAVWRPSSLKPAAPRYRSSREPSPVRSTW